MRQYKDVNERSLCIPRHTSYFNSLRPVPSMLLSLAISHPLHYSLHNLTYNTKKSSFSTLHISSHFNKKNSSIGSSRILRRSTRFHAKSNESDADTEPTTTTQIFEDKITVSENGGNPSTNFLSLLCPLLKLFAGGDPSKDRNDFLEVATSSLSTYARLPWGSKSLSGSLRNEEISIEPQMRMQLFEFEACPFCRRVREALTELDLSVEVYPCPKGSVKHRDMVKKIGGKEQFPFLVDPNTGKSIYESSDIVKYLFQTYGQGRSPSIGLLESTLFTGWMPTILRAGRGMTLWEKAKLDPPPKKLELFSYENNPYARIVREALCELELPYILHNVGKGSLRSNLLLQASGSNEVPFLIDPNTDSHMGNYKRILSYLFETYATIK